jgi:hypothetical protein
MTETEYWRDCQKLSMEIDDVTAVSETNEEIRRISNSDAAVMRVLNVDALFWKIHRHGLQTSMFIMLGRIFDRSPQAHSVHKVMNATLANMAYFSKDALAARKCAGGPKPDWLDAYMSNVWEPSVAELRPLKKSLNVYAAKFEAIYRPIRHSIYAHRLADDGQAEYELFKKTNRAELQGTIVFLRQLVDGIQQLYLNGRRPVIQEPAGPMAYAEEVRKSVRSVIRKVTSATE